MWAIPPPSSSTSQRCRFAPKAQAFRNIVNMLHSVRDGLVRDANNYEQQEQASQQLLRS